MDCVDEIVWYLYLFKVSLSIFHDVLDTTYVFTFYSITDYLEIAEILLCKLVSDCCLTPNQ